MEFFALIVGLFFLVTFFMPWINHSRFDGMHDEIIRLQKKVRDLEAKLVGTEEQSPPSSVQDVKPADSERSLAISVIRLFSVLFVAMVLAYPAQAADPKEMVVILHGIAKTNSSMRPVELALQKEGYETLSITYPSTDKDLDGIAAYLRSKHLTREFWQNAGKVHVVTHSMGGLVARRYLDTYKNNIPEGKLGSVVMLAPPNQGSEVSDLIHKLPPYQWYYGPAGNELTTNAQSQNKSDIYYDLGIIAGTKEWPYFVAAFVTPGKSDGRVTVEKTKLKGMKDHVTVNGTHTFIMDKPEVHRQILRFLKKGKFEHEE